jgi:cell division protein FtsB
MAVTRKRSSVSVTQFVALVVATIALSLIVDLGHKVAVYRHLQREEARLEQEIGFEEERRDYLGGLQEQVQTEKFLDDWARREGKMVKPGETLIVPRFEAAPLAPLIHSQQESQSSEESHWQEWWKLFFDRLPGT